MRVKRRVGTCVFLPVAMAVALLGAASAAAEVDQKLRDALRAASPRVRIAAVAAVSATADVQARPLLEDVLDDPDATVRAAAVAGLGRLEDPAALAALERISADADPTVQQVLLRVLPALRALRVPVYLGHIEDFSAGAAPLATRLKALTRQAFERRMPQRVVIHEDNERTGYGAAPLAVRSVKRRKESGNTFIDVRCELTLVEMPGKVLRAALGSTASAGVEGDTDPALEAELIDDALVACAPELADEAASFIEKQRRAARR